MRRQRIAAGGNRRWRFAVVVQSRECGDTTHLKWTVHCAAAYAALCRFGVYDLRVVTRSYSLSQLSLLKKHETMVPSSVDFSLLIA